MLRLTRRELLCGLAVSLPALSSCAPRRPPAPPAIGPPPSFTNALQAARSLVAADEADASIEKAAVPRLYVHGAKTERAVLLLHGFTNCPQQFDELARDFYRRGCNVFVPRLPFHGYRDRLTRALGRLTTADLERCAIDAFTIASGLGTRVSALGLSLGGTLCLWLTQNAPVDLTVPVAPFLIPQPLSERSAMLFASALAALPDMYWWWDPRVKEAGLPVYAYPGYPTHALSELIFFGNLIAQQAAAAPPLAHRCVLVLNANDNAVDNPTAERLLQTWNRDGAKYAEYRFTDLLPPHHDIVDPTTYPQGRTLVYPTLEAIALSGCAPASARSHEAPAIA